MTSEHCSPPLSQRVSSVQGFEELSAQAAAELSEDAKMRAKKMSKIGYKGDRAIEADEVLAHMRFGQLRVHPGNLRVHKDNRTACDAPLGCNVRCQISACRGDRTIQRLMPLLFRSRTLSFRRT